MAVQWRRSCQNVMVAVLPGTHVKDDRDCMSAGVEAGFRNIKTPSAWCSASAPYAAPLVSAGSRYKAAGCSRGHRDACRAESGGEISWDESMHSMISVREHVRNSVCSTIELLSQNSNHFDT